MTLTKEQILGADDLAREVVECPAWGGSVNVRTLTNHERDAFEYSIAQRNKKGQSLDTRGLKAELIRMVVVDDEGSPIFSDEDMPALQEKSAGMMNHLWDVAQRLNGFSSDDVEELAGE